MDAAHLLILTLLVVAPALAQSLLPNEMLREVSSDIHSTTSSTTGSMTGSMSAVVPSISLPNAPAPQRGRARVKVIDKKFVVVMAALGGAESLRFTTHKLVLDHELDAGAPWVTSVPPNQHLVAKYSGIYAAEFFMAYELKKPHSWLPGDRVIKKFWWAYPAAMLPIHIKNGVRSIRTQVPSCPVDECEAP